MTNIINSIINYFFYSFNFISPITFRTYNSFNAMFEQNPKTLNFQQLIASLWILLICLFLLVKVHKKELTYEKEFWFKFNVKYKKFNRYFNISVITSLVLIPFELFNINLFNKYDYFIFLISFLIFILFLLLYTFISNKKNSKTKILSLSLFDSIIVFALICLFNVLGTFNTSILIILYLLIGNYSKRSISFFVILINLFTSLMYFLIHIVNIIYFDWVNLIFSIIVPITAYLIYNLIFKTKQNFKQWFIAIMFIVSMLFYINYI